MTKGTIEKVIKELESRGFAICHNLNVHGRASHHYKRLEGAELEDVITDIARATKKPRAKKKTGQ